MLFVFGMVVVAGNSWAEWDPGRILRDIDSVGKTGSASVGERPHARREGNWSGVSSRERGRQRSEALQQAEQILKARTGENWKCRGAEDWDVKKRKTEEDPDYVIPCRNGSTPRDATWSHAKVTYKHPHTPMEAYLYTHAGGDKRHAGPARKELLVGKNEMPEYAGRYAIAAKADQSGESPPVAKKPYDCDEVERTKGWLAGGACRMAKQIPGNRPAIGIPR